MLTTALGAWLPLARAGRLRLWLLAVGLVFSSLLAPHLHPDHLLMLVASGAYWLVLQRQPDHALALGMLAQAYRAKDLYPESIAADVSPLRCKRSDR